jgi:hypothetical protein
METLQLAIISGAPLPATEKNIIMHYAGLIAEHVNMQPLMLWSHVPTHYQLI